MKSARILIALFVLLGLTFMVPGRAEASYQLKSAKDTLSDPRPNPASSSHTFTFTMNTGGAAITHMQFNFCTTPSGTCNVPANLTTTASTKGTLTSTGVAIDNTGWSLDNSINGTLVLSHGTGVTIGAGDVIAVPLNAITNNSINACDANGEVDTCYIIVKLCTASSCNASTTAEETIVSYTIVNEVTVSARVDPSFTFRVFAVTENTGITAGPNGITTTVASTASTLPFGNITVGIPKYVAHRLNVTTNTTSGYTVSMQMRQQMTGVYTSNNIDPFAATSVTWTTPQTWSSPTGATANIDTAWIGAHTTDADVSSGNFSTNKFGPVQTDAANVVMRASNSESNVSVFVTYAMEANAYQPADTYTGYLVYYALPTY